MKKFVALFLFFALLVQSSFSLTANAKCFEEKSYQASNDELKNQDVLDMLKAGVSAETIVAQIKTSKCAFDISTTTLQELKTAGAPEAVILAMVEAMISQQPKKVQIKVPDNTDVEIENAFDLSSATAKLGDNITFRVLRPLIIDGATVIATGALVNGKIVQVKRAGRWGRAGRLAFSIEEVIAVDGKPIPLKASSSIKGEGNEGEVATKTAIGVAGAIIIFPFIVLAPLALLNGFKRGESAVLPAGARFIVYVKGDAFVTAHK